MTLENHDFARTNPKNKDRAATTWAKDSVENLRREKLKLAPILATLERAKGDSATDLNERASKGSSDTQITALQGALKILYERNPDRYLDPGKIDGVYANVKNGKPDLAKSKTAAAMQAITGIRHIDEYSIAKVLDALKIDADATKVRYDIEDTGDPDPRLSKLRGKLPTSVNENGFSLNVYGRDVQINTSANGKYQVEGLGIAFDTPHDAIKAATFVSFCIQEFQKKGATETPWHIQPLSGDIEFDTQNMTGADLDNTVAEFDKDPVEAFKRSLAKLKNLGGLIDTEVTDSDNKKLPEALLAGGNITILVDHLNALGNWKK